MEVTSKSLLFLSTSPIASKHSSFPFTKVSAYKYPIFGKNSVKKRLGGCHIETVLAARPYLSYVSLSDSKLEKNLQLTWHPSQGQQKLVFQVIIPYYLQCCHFGVWSMFGSKMYGSRAAITQSGSEKTLWKLFGQNLLDGMTSQKCCLAAEYCSKWQQRCLNFGLLWS